MVTYLGILKIGIALALLAWVVSNALYNQTVPPGWASTLGTLLFMGSIQLFSLGIIGEYIRLIFLETKGRPTYITRNCSAPSGDRKVPYDVVGGNDGPVGAGLT
jgi:dolichol-phosphate mannosyltransferase